MTFSGQIKSELSQLVDGARHCQLAEMSALSKFSNKESCENAGVFVFSSENELTSRKYFTLLKKTFNIYKGFSLENFEQFKHGNVYRFRIDDSDVFKDIICAMDVDFESMRNCCKRAYIRGAFLSVGSVSDPGKSYHMEFVCQDEKDSSLLEELLLSFGVEAHTVMRKKNHVVYIKDGSQISDVLSVMGAHVAMMDFENTRILKDVRNSVNRKLNCEMANIGKTVTAAVRQINDITALMATPKYKGLPEQLKEMAELRTKYPEATLKELGELADPPIGKSGVNHRLRKLSELAEDIKEENYVKKGSSNPS